jgi:hypothetical protein
MIEWVKCIFAQCSTKKDWNRRDACAAAAAWAGWRQIVFRKIVVTDTSNRGLESCREPINRRSEEEIGCGAPFSGEATLRLF